MFDRVSKTELLAQAGDYRRGYEADQQEKNRAIAQQLHGTGANLFGPIRSSVSGEMAQTVARDPSWDALFQAMQNQGVDKMGGDADVFPASPRPMSTAGPGQVSLDGLRRAAVGRWGR